MDSHLRGPYRELPVHVVRKRDIHGVDLSTAQAVVVLVVRIDVLHAMFSGKLLELRGVVRNKCGQAGILGGVFERGQHRHLRDVA